MFLFSNPTHTCNKIHSLKQRKLSFILSKNLIYVLQPYLHIECLLCLTLEMYVVNCLFRCMDKTPLYKQAGYQRRLVSCNQWLIELIYGGIRSDSTQRYRVKTNCCQCNFNKIHRLIIIEAALHIQISGGEKQAGQSSSHSNFTVTLEWSQLHAN